MASPVPKSSATRQRRNRPSTAAVLEAGLARKVALPTRYSSLLCADCELAAWSHNRDGFEKNEVYVHEFDPVVIEWRPMTLAWWETIWDSPMAKQEWIDGDVPGLMALAMIWDQFFATGDSRTHAEARMASKEFGLSPLSRRQLQWEVKRLEAAKPAAPPARPARRRPGGPLGVLQGGKAAAAR